MKKRTARALVERERDLRERNVTKLSELLPEEILAQLEKLGILAIELSGIYDENTGRIIGMSYGMEMRALVFGALSAIVSPALLSVAQHTQDAELTNEVLNKAKDAIAAYVKSLENDVNDVLSGKQPSSIDEHGNILQNLPPKGHA